LVPTGRPTSIERRAGFRWAHNLAPYKATEAQRSVRYYESLSSTTVAVLAGVDATR